MKFFSGRASELLIENLKIDYSGKKRGGLKQAEATTLNIEEDEYPSLNFHIDGSIRGQWNGDYAWQEQKFNFTNGVHVLKWKVPAGVFGTKNWAYAWIDNVKIEKLS